LSRGRVDLDFGHAGPARHRTSLPFQPVTPVTWHRRLHALAWPKCGSFLRNDCHDAALSVASVLAGTAFACIAARHPAHQSLLQTLGGILLIGGFALLGCSLECTICKP
jgi:hypothetical protein